MMRILFFIAVTRGSSPGCNDVVNGNGKSQCFQRWTENKDSKEALKCCMSYKEGDYSEFNVPIIVFPHEPNEYRRENILEPLKCYPESFKDINGFFNFLDGYKQVPFNDFPDRTKSLNWNCYNTDDKYDGSQILYPISKARKNKLLKSQWHQIKQIKKRTGNNFCRSLLYEYHLSYTSKELQETVCDRTGEQIYPRCWMSDQDPGRLELSRYNPNAGTPQKRFKALPGDRLPIERFIKPILHIIDNDVKDTKNIRKYQKRRPNKTITVFEDFRESWREMGFQFPENVNGRAHHHAKLHREFHCGCFAYDLF